MLKNKMAATAISLSVIKQCAEILQLPPVGISDRVFKFTGYVHHYKSLPGTIFGLHFEKQDAAMGIFFHIAHFTSAYISLIIGPRGLECEINL